VQVQDINETVCSAATTGLAAATAGTSSKAARTPTPVLGANGKSAKRADIVIGYERGETIVIDSAVRGWRVRAARRQVFHIGPKAEDDDHVIFDADRGRLLLDTNGNEKSGVSVLVEFRNGALTDSDRSDRRL
jgi:hypothetical protein